METFYIIGHDADGIGKRKSVEEVAGEIWRCIKHDFEKYGISLPESWKGVGLAYGGYSRAVDAITTLLSEREAELVRRVESLSAVVIIEHEMDCKNGRRPCGAVEHPHRLADRCSIRRHDKTAINEALTIIKEVFKKQS